ncbi:unnamed protein product [Allacma fusca]|uniref:C2H2-type domain-containing protein n=1 Tax=Allacma fusca TaxID=39272 RepID=A0A8J2L792_9HEXA|nr:unnamed protein product [Allacma fusca]
MVKNAQLSLFEWEDGKCGVFKIYPSAAHQEGNLKNWIELAGGIVLDVHEEDPSMIPIVDLEWYVRADIEVPRFDQLPWDHFHPSYIYDCYEWELVFDLNVYRIGKSRFVQYDANRIIKRCISWSDLLLVSPAPISTQNLERSISTRTILRYVDHKNTTDGVENNYTSPNVVININSSSIRLEGGNYISPGDDALGDVNVETDLGFVPRVEIENDDELVLKGTNDADDDDDDDHSAEEALESPKVGRKLSDPAKKTKHEPSSKAFAEGHDNLFYASGSKSIRPKKTATEKKTYYSSIISDLKSAFPDSKGNEKERQAAETARSNFQAGKSVEQNNERLTPFSPRKRNSTLVEKTSSKTEVEQPKLNEKKTLDSVNHSLNQSEDKVRSQLEKTPGTNVTSLKTPVEKKEHYVPTSLKRRKSTLLAANSSEDREIELIGPGKTPKAVKDSLNEPANLLVGSAVSVPGMKMLKKRSKSKTKFVVSKSDVDQAVQSQLPDISVQHSPHPVIILEKMRLPSVANAQPIENNDTVISGADNNISSKKRKMNKKNNQEVIEDVVSLTEPQQHGRNYSTEELTNDSELELNMLEVVTSDQASSDLEILHQVIKEPKRKKSRRDAQNPTQDEALAVPPNPIPTGPKRFPCDQCAFTALKAFDLLNHLRVHTGEEVFRCSSCDFSTSVKSTLTRHENKKHSSSNNLAPTTRSRKNSKPETTGKPYRCEHDACDFSTHAAYQLRPKLNVRLTNLRRRTHSLTV